MKVLFICSGFPSSKKQNSGIHNFRSVQKLSNVVPEIQVLRLRSWRPWRSLWIVYQIGNITVWSFSFPYFSKLPKFLRSLNLIIYKLILYHFFIRKRIKSFTLLHSAGVTLAGIIGAYFSKKNNLKHIAQCMGSDINISLPVLFNSFGWKGFEKHVDIFTCNSLALKQKLTLLLPNVKSTVIYRGVDIQQFIYQPITKTCFVHQTLNFLYLGGLVAMESKGVETYNLKGGLTLLEAWSCVIKELNSSLKEKIKLFFGGPNTSIPLISKILDTDPAILNIDVVGFADSSLVQSFIEKSDVVIIPSLYEGMPNIGMEAASIGRPIIGSNAGGIPELVIHNKTGLIFDAGNKTQLAKCIFEYINNPDQIFRHGIQARKLIESEFDSNLFVGKYLKIYKEYNLAKRSK